MMVNRILLSLVMGATVLGAQTMPERPERLTFPPLDFELPLAKDFQAKLKNGIPVYLHADPVGVPFVRLSVKFRGGSYLDPKGKEGLAGLFGELLREGGTDKTSPDQLDERLDFMAGSIQSSCKEGSGELSLEVMAKDLQEGLTLFMEVLTQPAFRQDRLDLALKAARQSLEARNDRVESIATYQTGLLLNGEHHFTNAFTTRASLDAITRPDLEAYHARLLHPDNLVVAVTGSFERAGMLALLNRTLGQLKASPAARVSPPVPAPEFVRKPGLYLVDKDVPQSLVRLMLPGLRRLDSDWHAAVVLNQVLGGGGFTARLTKKIRSDEGLTYGINSSFNEGPYWKGNWTCSFQTKNASVPYALRLTLAEMDRIRREPVPEEELKGIKDGLIASFPSQWSNKKAVVNFFAGEQLKGWPADYYADFRARIQAVTAEDVQRVARKYLVADQLVVLVVGRLREAEAGEAKDHPGLLKAVLPLPMTPMPLRDPSTMRPLP